MYGIDDDLEDTKVFFIVIFIFCIIIGALLLYAFDVKNNTKETENQVLEIHTEVTPDTTEVIPQVVSYSELPNDQYLIVYDDGTTVIVSKRNFEDLYNTEEKGSDEDESMSPATAGILGFMYGHFIF